MRKPTRPGNSNRKPLEMASNCLDLAVTLDPNSIELAFSKLKALLRKAATWAVDAPVSAIATTLEASSSEECSNWFIHAACSHASTTWNNSIRG